MNEPEFVKCSECGCVCEIVFMSESAPEICQDCVESEERDA